MQAGTWRFITLERSLQGTHRRNCLAQYPQAAHLAHLTLQPSLCLLHSIWAPSAMSILRTPSHCWKSCRSGYSRCCCRPAAFCCPSACLCYGHALKHHDLSCMLRASQRPGRPLHTKHPHFYIFYTSFFVLLSCFLAQRLPESCLSFPSTQLSSPPNFFFHR